MLTDILIGIETLASFALVLLILLHSGRGGGLSDMFGSTVGTAAAGSTVAEKNLDRLTITVAVVFAFATVIIGLRWG
ncbi:MAG: preprotein translocase subunit SecG [Acidimicrobiales bacterium]